MKPTSWERGESLPARAGGRGRDRRPKGQLPRSLSSFPAQTLFIQHPKGSRSTPGHSGRPRSPSPDVSNSPRRGIAPGTAAHPLVRFSTTEPLPLLLPFLLALTFASNMSLADLRLADSPRHHLRSSSSHLPSSPPTVAQQSYNGSPDLTPVAWSEWTNDAMSPESSALDPTDALQGFLEENAFFGGYPSGDPDDRFAGLGVDVSMETEEDQVVEEASEGRGLSRGGSMRVRTRLQSRATKNQVRPAFLSRERKAKDGKLMILSSSSSRAQNSSSEPYPTSMLPVRAHSPSFRLHLPTSLALDASGASSSSIFPGGLPSPFRQSTPTSATMDPAHSVRSSSPSSTSSISNLRVGSSSAASSVYGGEGGTIVIGGEAFGAGNSGTPRRGAATLSRRSSASPKKGRGNSTKLSNLDRKRICLHHEAFPTSKQEDIGANFGVERSTVSKILKRKEHWLSLPDDDDDYSIRSLSAIDPAPTPAPVSSSSSSASIVPPQSPPVVIRLTGGRYPALDDELANWARVQVEGGVVLSDEGLQAKALELAPNLEGCENFKASLTWVERFKLRAGLAAQTFVDFMSPGGRRVHETVEEEDEEIQIKEDEDDADFDLKPSPTKNQRKSKRQNSTRRQVQSRTSSATDIGAARSSPSTRMDVDTKTPLRPSSAKALADSEATPTHSRTVSSTSASGSRSRNNDPFTSYAMDDHPHARPSSHSSRSSHAPLSSTSSYAGSETAAGLYSVSSGSAGASQYSNQDLSYPLQSPFQFTSQSPFGHYQSSAPASVAGSGANSPGGNFRHARSGSTASTTSSYSGLTAFSSQNGSGTPMTGSMYGSFSTTHSNSGSLPSTPATGYFGHGPDGTQSQLQAAFLVQQHSAPVPSPTQAPGVPTRRATISGGVPYNSPPAPVTTPPSTRSTCGQQRQSVSFDQAYSSLETALAYLSTEGQGYVSPADIIVLSDLKGKMASVAQKLGSSPAQTVSSSMARSLASSPAKQRVKLERTHSAGNLVGGSPGKVGMGTRRSQNASLLAAMGMDERD